MKKALRFISLILALVLITYVLSACGGQQDKVVATVPDSHVTPIPIQTSVSEEAPAFEDESAESVLVEEEEEKSLLTKEQRDSLNMLNYLAVLTQEINSSTNSRLFLEEAYSDLINNTNPNAAVNDATREQLSFLLDTLHNFRMVDVKRERLKYIYDQKRGQALRQAIPNPLGLLSAVASGNPVQIAASVIYMAIDAKSSYDNYTSEVELQYLQDDWALNDKEAEILHEIRKEAFDYMLETVGDTELPGELTVNEQAITTFVEKKALQNKERAILYLETNRQKYQALGDYWLALAKLYYDEGKYEKCLDSISQYDALEIGVFRADHGLANALPSAILSAKEVYDVNTYVQYATNAAGQILDNCEDADWTLRYFVAQTYVDLNRITGDSQYLRKAYDVTLNTVNLLVDEQDSLNKQYMAPVIVQEMPDKPTKEEKKRIKEYNDTMKKEREKALPPIYQPLMLNCDLLFAIADKIELSDNDESRLSKILRAEGRSVFYSPAIAKFYSLDDSKVYPIAGIDISFNGKEISIPAYLVTDAFEISVMVKEGPNGTVKFFEDWKPSKVERKDQNEIASFVAHFTSEQINKYKYKENYQVVLKVYPMGKEYANPLEFHYKAVNTKDNLLKQMTFWTSGIGFERVS